MKHFLPSLALRRRVRSAAFVLAGTLAMALLQAPASRAQSPATAQSLTYGPVHRYSFGAHAPGTGSSGDVILDSAGVAHGVLLGSGASYTGTGLRLNGGASASAAYVALPSGIISGSATSYPGYSSASYEVWVTVYGNLSWSRILDFGTGTNGAVTGPGGTQTGTDYFILTANTGTDPNVQVERSNGMPGGGLITLANANSLGTEMHLVVVYDAAAGVWKWYKNGVFQSQFSSLLGPDTILDTNNWLGRSNFSSDSNTNAAYHEFRIYDYALSDGQVLGNYQAGPNTLTSPIGITGPFAWYRLDDGSGGTAADASGGGNPGSLASGGAAFVAGSGIVNNASLNLNGGYVRIPNSVALVNPADALTIAAWINPTDWAGNRRIVQKGATNNQYRLTAENGVLKFEIASPVRTVTAALPATGVWTHVAGTYDGAALRLYVNGVQVAAVNASGPIPVAADDLFIGAYSTTAAATEKFVGLLDDVRLYSRALGSAEINVLATSVALAAPVATIQEAVGGSGVIAITRTGNLSLPLPVVLVQATGVGQAALNTRFILTPSNLNLTIPAGQSSLNVTVTPLADKAIRGTELVTLKASPGANYFINGTGSATVQILDTPLNFWKLAQFGASAADPLISGDTADPDHDGMSNLLEYALNANPQKSDVGGLTSTGVENGKLTYTYNRLKFAPEITYHVLWSPDLLSWTEPAVAETILTDNGTVQRVKATLPGNGGTSGFVKLQVVRN